MKLQKLLSYTRRAVDDYHMIEEGDKIAVGISGGKDSLTLLYALTHLARFYPKQFEIYAITVDLGLGMDFHPVEHLCKELNVPYFIVKTEIYDIVFHHRKESNPCSLCAKMRKGAFVEKMKELGCNKAAYAHHKDDIMETLIMSLLFEGRLHTFSPVTYLDRSKVTLIRPMMYIEEGQVAAFARDNKLPVVKNNCPADGYTKRQYAKELLRQLEHDHPGAKRRIFSAIIHGNLSGWPELPHNMEP